MRALVLIVEDEPAISALLEGHLRRAGYDVLLAPDEAVFARLTRAVLPSLLLIDGTLKLMSPANVIARWHGDQRTRSIPVLVLDSPGSTPELGPVADAELVARVATPFTPRDLLGAVARVLRRTAVDIGTEVVTVGCLRLDPRARTVTANGEPVRLGAIEFRMLHFLMKHPERVHSRSALLDQVWGDSAMIAERTVDVTVRRLRAELEPSRCDSLIQTVRGAGYRLSVIP